MRKIGYWSGPGPGVGTFTDTGAAFDAYVASQAVERAAFVDLYIFQLVTLGTANTAGGGLSAPLIERHTSVDYDVAFEGKLYKGGGWNNGWRIQRKSLRHEVGTGVTELELRIILDGADRLPPADGNGATPQLGVGEALEGGLFDGASVLYRRIVLPSHPLYPIGPMSVSNRGDLGPGDTSLGASILFAGKLTEVNVARSEAQVKIKSGFEKLQTTFPIHTYKAGCRWTLYDANCAVSRTGSFGGYSFQWLTTIDFADAADVYHLAGLGPAPTGFFDRGTLQFTSGALCGLTLPVEKWEDFGVSGNKVTLGTIPPRTLGFGVGVCLQAGCDKVGLVRDAATGDVSAGTCATKFNNLSKFAGFPHIPHPSTIY